MSKCKGKTKQEVEALLKIYSLGYTARLLGYKGKNSARRAGALRQRLKKLGWWEEFRKKGII